MLDETSLREFYEFVYPIDLVVRWLSYNLSAVAASASSSSSPIEGKEQRNVSSEGYLARREFCFTLLGDIFTRFRSYSNATELRNELIRCYPEKIDVGAVYSIRPNQKQSAATIVPVERELVFDIDMSDYDSVRSCCSGKAICRLCWTWMSCAAYVLRTVLIEDFGFRYILPVFSGRRGIHLWVCDRRARRMHDDERVALVGYLTVITPKASRHALVADCANGRPIHPTIRNVLLNVIDPAFTQLFLHSSPENPNSVQHPRGAAVVYEAILSALKMSSRREVEQRFLRNVQFNDGNVLDWSYVLQSLGTASGDIVSAVQLLIMYPRLDEHVSTRRDHLLKLPFCVHPATGSLCCPLEWSDLVNFDPVEDSPKLQELLLNRHMDQKWIEPMQRMLLEMSQDDMQEP